MPLENIKILSPSRYIVWTQAGFKKAIRNVHAHYENSDPVEGFPTQYPCVVSFSAGYYGYHYWHVCCNPLTKAIEDARAALQILIDADENHRALIKGEEIDPA